MKCPSLFACLILFGSAGISSCVSYTKHQQVAEERDEYKQDALKLDSIERMLAVVEEDNLNTNSYTSRLLREVEQLTVTNKSLYTNYQDLLAKVNAYSQSGIQAPSDPVSRGAAQPDPQLQKSLESYQVALQQKDLRIRQLEQQLAAGTQPQVTTRGGSGGTFGPSQSAPASTRSSGGSFDEACRVIQQEGAGMMAQLQQLHFKVGQALSSYSSSTSPIELSDPSTRLTIQVQSDLLLVPGTGQLSQNGRSALARLAQLVQPYSQLDLYIESYPASNLVNAWEQSALSSALIAKELALNGVRPDLLFPTGKAYPGQSAAGSGLAGSILFVFKPQYEQLHQKIYQPGRTPGNTINRGQ